MNRLKNRLVRWILLLTVACVAGQAGALEEPSARDIEETFATFDVTKIRNLLDVVTIIGKSDVRKLLLDLWHERRDVRPDIPWDLVKAPQIRIRIARVLVPAAQMHSGVREGDLLEYAWSLADWPDDAVARDAFHVIGPLARDEDMDRIERDLADGAYSTHGGYFGAVWALSARCGEREAHILDALQEREEDRARLDVVRDLRDQWAETKRKFRLCQ